MACAYKISSPVRLVNGQLPTITSGYGFRLHPVDGISDWHTAIDIAGTTGDLILAAADGIVTNSYFSQTGGNLVKIAHPYDGTPEFYTRYLHLDNRLVNKGEVVRAGDVIGTMGSTGTATGTHLHFEIRNAQDKAVDPTDCYLESKVSIPYGNPRPGSEGYGKPPKWVWWAAGGISLLAIAGIVIAATRDEDKRNNAQMRKTRRTRGGG